MTVRAKFYVHKVEKTGDGENEGYSIALNPVVGTSEENKEFFKWTPCGQITIGTVNPLAAKKFEVGQEYYVDFTKAEKAA